MKSVRLFAVTVVLLVSIGSACHADQGAWLKDSHELLPVISLRSLDPDNGQPTDERGQLRYLAVSSKVTRLDALGDKLQQLPVYLPDRWTRTEQVLSLEQEEFFPLLDPAAGRPVLYIHGYNEGFDKSVRRALWLRQQLQLQGRLVLISWPSDGLFTNYARDEADLYWSVPGLVQSLENLLAHYGEGGFDLIAHSLGGRGASLALAQLRQRRPGLKPLLAQVLLVAADMDVQIFAQQQTLLSDSCQRLSLYTSEHDEPLIVSAGLHGYPRLGQSGPHTRVLRDVDVIDVSDVPRRRATGHNYHLGQPLVQADIRANLAGRTEAQRGLLPGSAEGHWRLVPPAQ